MKAAVHRIFPSTCAGSTAGASSLGFDIVLITVDAYYKALLLACIGVEETYVHVKETYIGTLPPCTRTA